mmetsp:Transcript_28681/g.72144  ORF Transcript_28681/g.72144 Transcript_28681/m.72144 type:complete len:206 (-) Transcript_28681:43-660(-)
MLHPVCEKAFCANRGRCGVARGRLLVALQHPPAPLVENAQLRQRPRVALRRCGTVQAHCLGHVALHAAHATLAEVTEPTLRDITLVGGEAEEGSSLCEVLRHVLPFVIVDPEGVLRFRLALVGLLGHVHRTWQRRHPAQAARREARRENPSDEREEAAARGDEPRVTSGGCRGEGGAAADWREQRWLPSEELVLKMIGVKLGARL